MNKLLSTLAGLTLLFGATSCSENEDAPVAKGMPSDVTLTVDVPESFRARAEQLYGDGATNGLHLTYAIYRPDGEIVYSSRREGDPVAVQSKPGEWTLACKLITEETYSILFWADQFGDVDANPYTIDLVAGTMRVDYNKSMTLENLATDRADAYLLYQEFTVGDVTRFTLRRPFAQVNIGTTEGEIKNLDGYYHNVTTHIGLSYSAYGETGSLPTLLNYKTGKVTGAGGLTSTGQIDLTASDFDALDYSFPINNEAQYMYMAYILAPKDATGWGDASAKVDDLHLNVTLGKAPFTGELREPFRLGDMKNIFLANTRIIIVPACTSLPDPGPDPVDPDAPGFVETGKDIEFTIVYDPGFSGQHKVKVNTTTETETE